MKERIKKINWDKGFSEILGFMACWPLVMLMLVMFVMYIQMGFARQALEHSVYAAARAAVVEPTREEAVRSATEAAERVLRTSGSQLRRGEHITVSVNPMAGVAVSSTEARWTKGSLALVEVKIMLPVIGRNNTREMSASIVMMIENPAELA